LTERSPDRRSFLRRLGFTALAAPWAGCVSEPERAPGAEGRGGGDLAEPARSVVRPVLLPWGEDGVHLVSPPYEQPAAYVSMATRQLFVDFDYRDQVYWDLAAHISVSTGVWRIPLIGDDPKIPVTPGDELREFEELSMREWDPTARPVEGDIRIMRGRALPTRIDFTCAPLAGGGAWYRAGPWDVLQCNGPNEALCREDLLVVGTGARYADRDCTRLVGPARVLTWACLEEFLPADG
jgi:hypothetical protein